MEKGSSMHLGEGRLLKSIIFRVKTVGKNSLRAMRGEVLASRGSSLLISRSIQNVYYYNTSHNYHLLHSIKCLLISEDCFYHSPFIFLLMNSFSLKEITSKSIDLKSFAIIRCAKRTKTQRQEHSKNDVGDQQQEYRHRLAPLTDNSKEYQTIFSKRKRLEYSGYKQCNLNKSKFIRFQEDKKKNRHQPPRNYEMNLKNIARLRKRYSLEPSQVKFSFSEEKNI